MGTHAPEQENLAVDVEGDPLTSNNATEETPLLPTDLPPDFIPDKDLQRKVVFFVTLFFAVIEISMFILDAPIQQVMEDAICRQYFPDHLAGLQVEDARCKSHQIQNVLSSVRGWQLALESLIPLFVQIPFGIIADKYGRRPVLFLSLLGMCLAFAWQIIVYRFPSCFDIRISLFASAAYLVGGGSNIVVAMCYTMVSDCTPAGLRGRIFYNISALTLGLSVVCRPFSAFLLSKSAWLPIWMGYTMLVLSALMSLLVPETISLRRKADIQHRQEHGRANNDNPVPGAEQEASFEGSLSSKWTISQRLMFSIKNTTLHLYRFLFRSKMMLMMYFAFAIYAPIRTAVSGITLQYVTERFHLSWSMATYYSTIGDLASAAAILILLPLISKVIVNKFKIGPISRDLILAQVTCCASVLGLLLIALSPTLGLWIVGSTISSFGTGFNTLFRSVLSAVVEPHTVATLFTMLSLIASISGFAGVPFIIWLKEQGLELGGVWRGLPFMVSAILMLFVTAACIIYRMPRSIAEAERRRSSSQ